MNIERNKRLIKKMSLGLATSFLLLMTNTLPKKDKKAIVKLGIIIIWGGYCREKKIFTVDFIYRNLAVCLCIKRRFGRKIFAKT